jgi:uncharacterized protein
VSLVYWDTMLFIYAMEGHPQYGKQVDHIYKRMLQRGDQLCTSLFTVGEVLTGLYKAGDAREVQRASKYFFQDGEVRLLAFDHDTADRYARIRAQHRIAPADAIHLASAAVAKVDLYLTNDARLKKLFVEGIQFIAGLDGVLF